MAEDISLHFTTMKLSQFKYKLPDNLIAQYPSENRDECRLMVLDAKTGEISHHIFKEIIDFFDEGDVMVFNDTKVFPARLYGNKEKTGACIEVFLLRELNVDNKFWDVLVEPARKIRIGNKLYFGEDDSMVAEVIDNTTSRGRTLRFLYDGPHDEFKEALYALGQTPLPEYITRPVEPEDAERYQNIFARVEGAVMVVDGDLVDHVNDAKDAGHRVCAVGASVLRAISSAVCMNGHIMPYSGWTNKFIFPPYEFTVCDAMVTNFHLPLSTMLMMVSAFGGYRNIMHAYEVAVKEGYRFGAYGDAMLILR